MESMLEKTRVLAAMRSIGMAVMAEASAAREVRHDTGGLRLRFVDLELEVQLHTLFNLGRCKSQTSSALQ